MLCLFPHASDIAKHCTIQGNMVSKLLVLNYYSYCISPPLVVPGKHPDVPSFPLVEVRDRFKFLSLTTSPEALSVLESVREECGKVCEMSLFHTGVSKHLKLEEFDQTQQQASMQVQLTL